MDSFIISFIKDLLFIFKLAWSFLSKLDVFIMPFLFYDKPQQRERKEDFMMKNERIYKLVLTALMAALSYVVFTFLQIKIALPGGDATSIHLGNAVCVLGALLLGGVYGGIGGHGSVAGRHRRPGKSSFFMAHAPFGKIKNPIPSHCLGQDWISVLRYHPHWRQTASTLFLHT